MPVIVSLNSIVPMDVAVQQANHASEAANALSSEAARSHAPEAHQAATLGHEKAHSLHKHVETLARKSGETGLAGHHQKVGNYHSKQTKVHKSLSGPKESVESRLARLTDALVEGSSPSKSQTDAFSATHKAQQAEQEFMDSAEMKKTSDAKEHTKRSLLHQTLGHKHFSAAHVHAPHAQSFSKEMNATEKAHDALEGHHNDRHDFHIHYHNAHAAAADALHLSNSASSKKGHLDAAEQARIAADKLEHEDHVGGHPHSGNMSDLADHFRDLSKKHQDAAEGHDEE